MRTIGKIDNQPKKRKAAEINEEFDKNFEKPAATSSKKAKKTTKEE